MGRKLATAKQKYPQPINKESSNVIRIRSKPQPKSEAQRFYMESLNEAKLTIGTGPAGSGKTFLAMAVALDKLLSNEVSRIVITRPIVEAGDSIGFLPGTFEEKISPYLLPLLDAITDLVGATMAKKLLDNQSIEFAPLGFMRGRTFNNAYVILDEAQNTTVEQMKLFVTRIGEYAQFVVNGDVSQSDLQFRDPNTPNGLAWVTSKLRGVSKDIQVVEFTNQDVVRSEIVRTILTHLDAPDHVQIRNQVGNIRHDFYGGRDGIISRT